MGEQSAGPTVTVGDLLEWLIRRWWVVALAVVLGAGAGWYGAASQDQVYTSRTSVLVRPLPSERESGTRVNLDTEAQVVRSTTTAELAQQLLETDDPPAKLLGRLGVSVPANTSVLVITYQGTSPGQAQAGASAFATAYLDQRRAEAEREIERELSFLGQQLEELTGRLDEATRQVAETGPGTIEQRQAQQLQQNLAGQLAVVHGRMLPLESTQVQPGSVLSPAELPSVPTDPNPVLYTAGGLVAGVLFGLSAALLVHRLDSRVRRRGDLPGPIAGRVLAELTGARPPVAVAAPATPVGREFSRLRNVLRAAAHHAEPGGADPEQATAAGVLLVCGAVPGAASGFAAANLAAAFARVGERVTVVVSDPESAALPALGVGVDQTPGLRGVLADHAVAEAVVDSPVAAGVSVLPPGGWDLPELPVSVLITLLLRLHGRADRVILQTAPVSDSIDAQALSVAVSGVLLVVQRQRTRVADVSRAVEEFALVEAPLLGAVLLPARFREPAGQAMVAALTRTARSAEDGTVRLPRLSLSSSPDER